MKALVPFLIYIGLLALLFSGKLPGSRVSAEKNSLPMPKRIFAIIVFLSAIAFFIGTNLASRLWTEVIPYCVFGIDEVSRQAIKITINARQYVEFSNGIVVHGLKFFMLEMIWMVFMFIFVVGLWIL